MSQLRRRDEIKEQVDNEGNQPITQLAELEPKPEEVERTDGSLPATEDELQEAPAPLENPTNSFLEGGAGHKTAVTPGINEVTNQKLPLAQPGEQGECSGKANGGGVDDANKVEKDDAESALRKRDDAKSIPVQRTMLNLSSTPYRR